MNPDFFYQENTDMKLNKYLQRYDDGQVDWSLEGMRLLTEFVSNMADGLDLSCRSALSEILMSRGFKKISLHQFYELSDGQGRVVEVHMDDYSVRVIRDGVIYNGPMDYAAGQDELCDLWDMIRNAWNADARF